MLKNKNRWFVALLAAVIAVALLGGCKGGGEEPQVDPTPVPASEPAKEPEPAPEPEDDASGMPALWPAKDLPPDFPPYTDGVIESVEPGDTGLYIYIAETDIKAFEAYIKTLDGIGWEIDDSGLDGDVFDNIYNIIKGSWMVTLGFDDGYITIIANDLGFELIAGGKEWPKNLPYDLPPYPDGDIVYADLEEDGKLYVSIEGSSEETFKKYCDMVKKAGWEFSRDIDVTTPNDASKDKWVVLLNINNGNEVLINVMVF